MTDFPNIFGTISKELNADHQLLSRWTEKTESVSARNGLGAHVVSVTLAALTPLVALADAFQRVLKAAICIPVSILLAGPRLLGLASSTPNFRLKAQAWRIVKALALISLAAISTVSLPFYIIKPRLAVAQSDFLRFRPAQAPILPVSTKSTVSVATKSAAPSVANVSTHSSVARTSVAHVSVVAHSVATVTPAAPLASFANNLSSIPVAVGPAPETVITMPENKTWHPKTEGRFYQRYPKTTMIASLAIATGLAFLGYHLFGPGKGEPLPPVKMDPKELEDKISILTTQIPDQITLDPINPESICVRENTAFRFEGDCTNMGDDGTSEIPVPGKVCQLDTQECWEGTYTYKDFKVLDGIGVHTGGVDRSKEIPVGFSQQGSWVDGQIQGLGTRIHADGFTFKGYLNKGEPSDFGVVLNTEGKAAYLGYFNGPFFQGPGVMEYNQQGYDYLVADWVVDLDLKHSIPTNYRGCNLPINECLTVVA